MHQDSPKGTVGEGFEAVRDEFAAVAAAEGGDYAAQLVAYLDGERVVDLWTGPEMTADTLTGLFSCTKGAAHLVVALLVQDGVLDLDERVRAPHDLDFYLGLPERLEDRFLTSLPMRPSPEQQAELDAAATGPGSLTGIAFNRRRPDAPELWELPNHRVIREKSPASVGGVGSARGLAKMYAAAISEVDGQPPLLKPETAAIFGQTQSIGYNLVTRRHGAFAVGFSAVDDLYPVLGQGAFGHSGADGSQAFADPRSGLAYGYTRRRFAFPGGAGPENVGLVRALHGAATQ